MTTRRLRTLGALSLMVFGIIVAAPVRAATCSAANTVTANVVVFDQPLMFNRLGAQNINGIMYALRRDVVDTRTKKPESQGGALAAGFVGLREDKRPRPLVLRVAAGNCLTVNFQNFLAAAANPRNLPIPPWPVNFNIDDQNADRHAGFHAQGMQLVGDISSDASYVGKNQNSLVPAGASAVYQYFAEKEGTFLVTSHGATFGSDGTQGNSANGMFAAVNVEPKNARFYRSQVTEEEMRLATTGTTATGQPVINYEAKYPAAAPWDAEGKAGLPVLNMLNGLEIVHSDLNAVIAGPDADGTWKSQCPGTNCPYPLESVGKRNPTVPNRLEAFREFTVVFHDEQAVANAYPLWYLHPILRHTLHAVGDVFMINYGSGAIGTEVISSRLGVGPMHDCVDCAYEEFFLTSYAVGDPAMVVDVPANAGLESCDPDAPATCVAIGPKASKAFYPDDPSNVHHTYINDFTKFRNLHTGKEHHIFHLHNHQWLFNPNDDNSNYLDAQGIGPGSGYSYEINFGGSGNRNKSAGDAIFHCHFYPHFAQGMWELWRHHDVMETGTQLAVSGGATSFHSTAFALRDGTPALDGAGPARVRSLPDGEIVAGTPIPALVPLPGKPMAPMPGKVTVVPKPVLVDKHDIATGAVVGQVPAGSNALVDRTDKDPALVNLTPTPLGNPINPTGLRNPGFPFWVAGAEDATGQRTTTPVLDMTPKDGGWDGGLPRHALDGYAASGCGQGAGRAACSVSKETRLDLTKEMLKAKPIWYPEDGTDVEKAAMAFHAVRKHPSFALNLGGAPVAGDFITNGSGRPVSGAPFHEPCIDDAGNLLKAGVTGTFFDGSGGLGTTGSSPFNADTPRLYKGSNIQFDAVLNKLGYHFSQERIITLWQDAVPTITKQRPPEPFVLRMNTFDCTMYHHTNLVPSIYELDDYQVRTTTDIIGQHIHLPKWDLTTTDGSANGWNYEDGTLSPDAVRERIAAINAFNPTGAGNPADAAGRPAGTPLIPEPHPFFGAASPAGVNWLGARTTLERWFSDPVVNADGVHRGLGIIFTHDHFGPSTHQQIGLYATVLIEPPGSTWVHNETGVPLYTRPDGGPTSWQAAILTGDLDGDGRPDSYREFYFEYSDFQHAYKPGVYVGRAQDGTLGPAPDANSFRFAVNPSVKEQANPVLPDILNIAAQCPVFQRFPGQVLPAAPPRPCPEAISADDPGYYVVNYRNEPIGERIFDRAKVGPDGKPGMQADGLKGDLAFALQSRTDRANPLLNVQPVLGTSINGTTFPAPINTAGVGPGDPFTPMARAYFGDRVRVKIQAGGDEESHNASVFGMKWLHTGSGYGFGPNSGWRASQHAGISEQFTFAAPVLPALNLTGQADYVYTTNQSTEGWWDGVWGLMRTYAKARADLYQLPDRTVAVGTDTITIANKSSFSGVCPVGAKNRNYDVTAVLANDLLGNAVGVSIIPTDAIGSATMHVGGALKAGGGTLVYNPRNTTVSGINVGLATGGLGNVTHQGPLHDPTAILFVKSADIQAINPLDSRCLLFGVLIPTLPNCPIKLRAGAPVEPIVLRAAAGECVNVLLRNRLPAGNVPDLAGFKHVKAIVTRDAAPADGVRTFNMNLIRPSSWVGMRPGLVDHDASRNGMVVGSNAPIGVAPPGGLVNIYQWYAGDISLAPTTGGFNLVATPVEFGGAVISPADPIKQTTKGLVGAVVVEPAGSSWAETDKTADHQTATAGVLRETRAMATVNGSIRDLVAVVQKGQNHRYKDGSPVEQIAGEGVVGEDSEDAGQMGINYGSEPLWFRFGLVPQTPFTGPNSFQKIPNTFEAYSNGLAGVGGDPATPVWTAPPGASTRMHLVYPAGINRASTFTMHGHVWQRDPYVCPHPTGSPLPDRYGLPGLCNKTGSYPTLSGFEVGSKAIGLNPIGFYKGEQDLVAPGAHFDLVFPSAGGANKVIGDYLFHDRAGFGNTSGLWSILRVQ